MPTYSHCTAGDVVTLQSGGQKMTVKAVTYEDVTPEQEQINVYCTWFNTNLGGLPIEATFPREILTLIQDESPSAYQHHRFVVGDVVKLRSGGPAMTVAGFEKTGTVRSVLCVWIDNDNRDPLRGLFQLDSLVATSAT
ncbi:DUF2158 domain-containing protein [Aeromonas veronii]|uniref:DUF2158 domain-containing protein n=1 Tax=Aeromonas veronii TaxID=654 RepID=UPI001BD080B8|nr:DUF2158 domain-containing protein [Aeromonas veronii]MBS4726743.1 DUF2158 domain-containing protein [Aeromonas veronii]